MKRIYLFGALGTIIEWYDFCVYAYLASVFAQIFFVTHKPWLSMVLVYTAFFISYLARPLGGVIFGNIGDRFGRKKALLLAIGIMTMSMFATMLLPTWHTIGIMAPLLLLMLRIIQSLSAGGETTGSFIYVLESCARNRHGLYGSLIWSMTFVGALLASGVIALLHRLLSHQQLLSWGWRLTYLIGAVGGIIIFVLRTFITESLEFAQAQQQADKQSSTVRQCSPLKEALFYHKATIFMITVLLAFPAVVVSFTLIYFPHYIQRYFNYQLTVALDLNTAMLLIATVVMVLSGVLSDRIGYKRMAVFSACCLLLLSYPILHLMMVGSWIRVVIAQLLLTLIIVAYEGAMPAIMVRLPPLEVRYTVVSLGFNIAASVFTGSSLLIFEQLARVSSNHLAPAFYFMVLALLSLVALFLLRHNSKLSVEAVVSPRYSQ
ncbi:MAG: MHS family MFS transporter [Gammaproteobacteria bacterium]|nr:MHS family MFS transporter [Gammaproteobacteria bacterium]